MERWAILFRRSAVGAFEGVLADPGVSSAAVYEEDEEARKARLPGLPRATAFHACLDLEVIEGEAARRVASMPLLGSAAAYRVEARTLKADPNARLFVVAPVVRAGSMTRRDFDEYWRVHHAPLALRHHVGMTEYRQCLVVEGVGPASSSFDGIAFLGFPNRDACERGFLDSKDGARAIAADSARFVDMRRSTVALLSRRVLHRRA
jgi:uncharacterized protein (TIGR02118 family)